MSAPPSDKSWRVIRRARVTAWLLPLGSLGVFLGAVAASTQLSWADFFARLGSPLVILLFFLFALIYLPATLRIYYVLLLDAKGVFTAAERRGYQERQRFWEKVL
jgi:hypothetical protein